jgi:Transposase
VWNRQEALRFQRQNAAAEKAAERERKLQVTAAGKAQAEQLNADLEARVARLESILRRGLDKEAAIDLNAMLRTDEFPPLGLGEYEVVPPRPVWTPPPEPRVMAGFFGAKSRHDRRVAEARELFERAERDYERAEAARQQWMREQAARHDAAVQTHQAEVARHNNAVAQLAAGLRQRDRESVQHYLELALSGTLLPDEVPHAAEVEKPQAGRTALSPRDGRQRPYHTLSQRRARRPRAADSTVQSSDRGARKLRLHPARWHTGSSTLPNPALSDQESARRDANRHPAPAPVPEVTRLGRTLRQWRDQILAYVAPGGLNNGGTEALNLIIDKTRRLAQASATSPTTDYASCSPHTEPGPADNDLPMLNPAEPD